MLAFAGAAAVVEGSQDANGCVQPGDHVEYGDATAIGWASRVTRQAHQSRHRLHDEVVAGEGCPLRRSETTDGGIDDPGVLLPDRVIIQAKALKTAGLEILDEDICAGRELLGQPQICWIVEIEGDRALVAVDSQVIGCNPIAVRWQPGTGLIPSGAFDFDYRC